MNHVPDGPMDRIVQALATGAKSQVALLKLAGLDRRTMHKKLNLLRKQKRLMTARMGRHVVYELKAILPA